MPVLFFFAAKPGEDMRSLWGTFALLIGSVAFSSAPAQPAETPAALPAGATGICNDGSYTYKEAKKGSCSGRQGIREWFADPRKAVSAPPTAPVAAPVPPAVLKAGQSVDLGPAYWAEGCTSNLVTIVGIDVIEGPPGLRISVRKEDVFPSTAGVPRCLAA